MAQKRLDAGFVARIRAARRYKQRRYKADVGALMETYRTTKEKGGRLTKGLSRVWIVHEGSGSSAPPQCENRWGISRMLDSNVRQQNGQLEDQAWPHSGHVLSSSLE